VADTSLHYKSAAELAKLIAAKKLSPVELTEACLSRIEATEPKLNSFITPPGEEAIAAAKKAEQDIARGDYKGPLHGIPFAMKDLFYVQGMRSTCGSRILDRFVPDHDGTVVSRLKVSGAIIFGKTNLHQFAFGPTGLNADYGNMHNPWDIGRLAGGSSGGSGSAIAAGQCPLATGTDTGGSIRIPASLCGISGIKPTYGRVSRHGVVPLAWTLDHPGPMARTVEDCAIALQAMAGHDPNDSATSKRVVPDYRKALTGKVKGLRIGVPEEYWQSPVDPRVRAAVEDALDVFKKLGASVRKISWPMYKHSATISTPLIYAEATAYHRDMLSKRGKEYDPSIRWRLELGLFITAEDYLTALRGREAYTQEALGLLKDVDIIVGPTEPVAAPSIEATDLRVNGVPIGAIGALTQYTRPFNITGFPAMSVPCGFVDDLPVGLQLAGRPFDEAGVLNAAYSYQQATDWHTRRPPI
jgi:aspartyl-tRNA(Asn)/glutamyl-tRNA(Gln) amidotransferase subunit A